MTKALFIEGNRNGYGADQIEDKTITIRELIESLEEMAEEMGDDCKVFLMNDNGYTYGSIGADEIYRGGYDDNGTRILEAWESVDDLEGGAA